MSLKDKKIPHHLGIILDGNRRWAKEKGLPVFEGHKKGRETAGKIIQACKAKGVKILTLFVFSTENWNRPKNELGFLMKLLKEAFSKKSLEEFLKGGIKVRVIGQTGKLTKEFQKRINEIERFTMKNNDMTVNFALSYGGRAEITEAIRNIIKKKIPAEKVTEEVISQNLLVSDLDLMIRTGKEQRISNFLIWQSAYSELYFCNKYWPDFSEKDLDEAFKEYSKRQRRFGK